MALLVTPEDRAAAVVRRLLPGEGGPFVGMTYPAYRPLLDLAPGLLHPEEGASRKLVPVAVGAWAGERPVGLALGGIPAARPRVAEALSLFVAPAWRRRGLAAEMVRSLGRAVADQGSEVLTGVYMTSTPQLSAVEALAARLGAVGPVTRMMVVKFTVDEAKTVRWYGTYRPRAGLEFFPWNELRPEELAELQASQAAEPWIPDDLVPWQHHPERLEPASSIGARLDGKVVGWVLNHRLGPDLVRFTSAFIRADLARRGRLVPLFSEAIHRLDGTPYRRCTFTTPVHHREMVAFIRRHCERWVSFVGETREAWIHLRPVTSGDRGNP